MNVAPRRSDAMMMTLRPKESETRPQTYAPTPKMTTLAEPMADFRCRLTWIKSIGSSAFV